MPNKPFDWSTLTRISIYDHMERFRSTGTKRLPVKDHYKLLANHIRKIAPLRVSTRQNYNVPRNAVIVSGQYYSDLDQEGHKCIQINLLYSPFDKKIKLQDNRYIWLSKEIADTLLHEIIHMRQFRRRDFKNSSTYRSKEDNIPKRIEQCYLGNTDEIDAFGFNIACEVYDRFGSQPKAIEKFLAVNRPKKHSLYKYYLSTFDYNHSHPVIQKLKKKVINYLPLAEMGKPYKNSDWIWY